MKLIMERWNRFSIQEESVLAEQKSEIDEGFLGKALGAAALVAALLSPGKAQAAEPTTPGVQTTQQVQGQVSPQAKQFVAKQELGKIAQSLGKIKELASSSSIDTPEEDASISKHRQDIEQSLKNLADNGFDSGTVSSLGTLVKTNIDQVIDAKMRFVGLGKISQTQETIQSYADYILPK